MSPGKSTCHQQENQDRSYRFKSSYKYAAQNCYRLCLRNQKSQNCTQHQTYKDSKDKAGTNSFLNDFFHFIFLELI